MLVFAPTIRQLLKPLQAIKTTSPLVQQCLKALKDISTQHSVGLFWVPGLSGLWGNETANKLARDRIVHHFVGPDPALGVSKENIRKKIKCWIDNQHIVMWRNLISTQRQARKMILGPSPTLNARFLSFYRTQSRVVTGLLTGHNTLKRHLHLMGLSCRPVCTRCGAEEEPQSTSSVSVTLWLFTQMHTWVPSFWTQRMLGA
jgi:hypothetical protein